MQTKTLVILAIILVILTAIWAATTYLPRLTAETSPYVEKVKTYDKTTLQSIKIENSSNSLELKKEANDWKIDGKKANKAKIDSLINALLPDNPPELIAQTDKRHQEFGLTSESATNIVLDNKLKWLIGKNIGSSNYVRFKDDNKVYLLKLAPSDFSTQADDWFDKTILKFDRTTASKLTFKEAKKSTVLLKNNDQWSVEGSDKKIDKEKINSILSEASTLVARSLYGPKQDTAYQKTPLLTFSVEYNGGSETLEFFKDNSEKSNSDYLVKRLSDGEKFIVGEYAVSSIVSAPKKIYDSK